MFYSMLQTGINWLIMAYVDHLRLSGLKSELVKDRYVVLCTVTMTTQKHKQKQKQSQNQSKQKTPTNKAQKTTTKQNKKPTTPAKKKRDRYQFMCEKG